MWGERVGERVEGLFLLLHSDKSRGTLSKIMKVRRDSEKIS